jgi:hypothetical protein|tara:strand:+ start:1502 stop:2179 length:678 start_codon:yes stop_codon:yes gene_type:complete
MANFNNQSSLSSYYLHFAKGDKREIENISNKKFKKSKRVKLNNNYDKLFFNFLLIVRMESISLDYNKNVELKLKYEFAQKMENMKFKKIEDVINNLCYDDNINLKTLSALCVLLSKTMFYFSQNVFVMLNQNENTENEKSYLVEDDLSIVCVKKEKQKELQDTSFEIHNLEKPFYSMSHYKVDELKEISLIIGLNVEGKKKDIYEKISQHLSNAILKKLIINKCI